MVRMEREEARIDAWEHRQTMKAEAELKKLEVIHFTNLYAAIRHSFIHSVIDQLITRLPKFHNLIVRLLQDFIITIYEVGMDINICR